MRTDASLPGNTRAPWWKSAAHLGLLALLVAIFVRQIARDWPEIVAHPWDPNWALMAAALGLLLLTSTLDIFIWNRTLGWFTAPLPFHKGAAVYIWSYLARYIPGKVPSLLIRAAVAAEAGRHPVPVLASSAVELALRLASAFLLLLAAFTVWSGGAHHRAGFLLAVTVIPLVLVCAHPRIMLPVMNWALRRIKQPTLDQKLPYHEVLGVFCALVLRWAIYGGAFTLLVWAVARPMAVSAVNAVTLIGTATGAWIVGFLSFLPAGIGATEFAQFKALRTMGGITVPVVVIPVLFRLWSLLAEGLWSLIALGLWRMKDPKSAGEAAVATVNE